MESHAVENNRPVVAAFAPSGGKHGKSRGKATSETTELAKQPFACGARAPEGALIQHVYFIFLDC